MRLILASASPSRLRLLRLAGVEPEVIVSDVDEEALVERERPGSPAEYVQLLATAKARAVARRVVADSADEFDPLEASCVWVVPNRTTGVVVGCDSAFELEGEIFNKPHTAAAATERWRAMRGRTAQLHTGHCVIDLAADRAVEFVSTTELDFAEVSDAEIDWYVRSGEPLEVAGAFTLDGLASAFVTRIDGDPHSVIGLSVSGLRSAVHSLGHDWTEIVG